MKDSNHTTNSFFTDAEGISSLSGEVNLPPLGDGGSSIWFAACKTSDVPANGGVCVKYKDEQIALFHFARRNEWYATQNQCPHRKQMALSRGMIGSQNNEPKVACPFHKKTFSLITGECLSGDECAIKTYPVKVENGQVFIEANTNQDVADTDYMLDNGRGEQSAEVQWK